MAGLNNTRQQTLPSLEEAQHIVRNRGKFGLKDNSTGKVVPMGLMDAMKTAYTPDDYKNAYVKALREAGYSDRAVSAMMGVAHGETGGFPVEGMIEHGRYTDPNRIKALFGSKKPEIAKQAKRIAAMDEAGQYNALYGDRADLGNIKPGDGYRYRGRGMVHLTGRQAYEAADKAMGMNGRLIKNPDLVASTPEMAARSAIAFYQQPDKLGNRRDFGLDDVLPIVGGARSSWKDKRSYAEDYMSRLPPILASQ